MPDPLSRHTVAAVTTAEIGYRYPRPVGRNSFRPHHGREGTATAYVVSTDRGATGWGLPVGGGGDPAAVVGRPLADVFDPATGVTDPAALPLDHALHDLAGRILDLPVHTMLGAGAPAPRCYSGALYFDDLDAADGPAGLAAVAANLEQDHALGFHDVKLKIGRGYRWLSAAEGLRRDIEVTRLARDRLPQAAILVDANDGYSPQVVAEYLDATADCDLYWLEEPFPERVEDLRFLRQLLDRMPRPPLVADGEYEPDVPHVLWLARERLLDVALMDVVSFGITGWRRVMPALAAAGAQASPHAWGLPLKTLYAAHLAVGLGNVATVEGVPGDTLGTDGPGFRLEDGRVHLSNRPGYGVDLT